MKTEMMVIFARKKTEKALRDLGADHFLSINISVMYEMRLTVNFSFKWLQLISNDNQRHSTSSGPRCKLKVLRQ